MYETRLEHIRDMMANIGFDAVAVVPGANFKKIFNRDFHLMERPLMVIVPYDGEPVAIVPNLEMIAFEKIAFQGRTFYWSDQDGYRKSFLDAADSLPQLQNARQFGLEAQRMRAFEQMALQESFPNAKFVDAHAGISAIRLQKTDDEIKQIKKAIEISEAALEATILEVTIGQSEKEIEAILLKQLFANHADGLAFHPIVAAAENSAQPHAQARLDYKIKQGDALLIDFGASWNGYNADITRTFFVRDVSDYDREFYQTVLDANERGRQVSKLGLAAGEVDEAVQMVLENSKFAAFANHKTGHGLGLDVHEAPQIMRANSEILTEGMVYTIEPGLYRTGECGVRIEDVVVVAKNTIECLTSFQRELRIVG